MDKMPVRLNALAEEAVSEDFQEENEEQATTDEDQGGRMIFFIPPERMMDQQSNADTKVDKEDTTDK